MGTSSMAEGPRRDPTSEAAPDRASYDGVMDPYDVKLDGVEIKANIGGEIDEAIDRLRLSKQGPWRVWFFDTVTDGSTTTLLDQGIALRARADDDEGSGDFTAKLRPCNPDQLTEQWRHDPAKDGLSYSIEEDWSAAGRVLAVSARVDLSPGMLAEVVGDTVLPADIATDDQEGFLRDCANLPVPWEDLSRLGPITAIRWRSSKDDTLDELDVRAERWTAAGLDFLEVSVKVDDPADADGAQAKLLERLDTLGVPLDDSQLSKTRRMLQALAAS